jgi:hypothetical protein
VRWAISASLIVLALVGPSPARASEAHPGSPIAEALDKFDFGDYEGVVGLLRPLVDNGATELPVRADRLEALRVYGIACALTDRRVAAEGAFLLLLREEPTTSLDPALVRPDAVAFFDDVRRRHQEELLAVYRRTRPRYYWFLNLIPTVGQFQNRERAKGFILGAFDLGLLTTTVVSYELLSSWEGADRTFAHHGRDYDSMRVVNYVSFGLLLGSISYGIIDGFVIGQRRQRQERDGEAKLGLWGP